MDEWRKMVETYRGKEVPATTNAGDADRIPRIVEKIHRVWTARSGTSLCQILHEMLSVSPFETLQLRALDDAILEARLDAVLGRGVPRYDAASDHVPLPRLAGMRAGPIVGEAGDAKTAAHQAEQQ